MEIKNIHKFSEMNNISITVLFYDSSENDFGIRYSPNEMKPTHVNLLILSNETTAHYLLVTNMSRLLNTHRCAHKAKAHFCCLCLSAFTTKEKLKSHISFCKKEKPQAVYCKNEGEQMEYSHKQFQLRCPFVIYADFECYLVGTGNDENIHKPASFAYHVISDHPGYRNKGVVTYKGSDAAEKFLKYMQDEENEMAQLIQNIIPVQNLTNEELDFHETSPCCICGDSFNPYEARVIEHCHLSGKYRGPAHNSCNLNLSIYKDTFKVPILFHNGKQYDFHLLVPEMSKYDKNINVLPKSMDGYLQIQWGKHLTFKDSMLFLKSPDNSASLEKLVSDLVDEDFVFMKKYFGNHYELLSRKGIFPYEWFTDEQKMSYPQLPAKEDFKSKLTNTTISDDDYLHAQNVWHTFNCTKFENYHDIYLICDVLLLSDVMEKFRATSMQFFNLDPLHHCSLPSFGWQCMLKQTKVKLDYVYDVNMHLMLEDGIRGGVSSVMKRYAKANNPYVFGHDATKENSYIVYIDKNSLYPEAMLHALPEGDLKVKHLVIDNNRICLKIYKHFQFLNIYL